MSIDTIILTIHVLSVVAIIVIVAGILRRARQARRDAAHPEDTPQLNSTPQLNNTARRGDAPQDDTAHMPHRGQRKTASEKREEPQQREPAFPGAQPSGEMVFGRLTPILAALFPDSHKRRDASKRELQAAGYYSRHAWENYAASRYLAMMLPLLACGVLLLVVPRSLEMPVLGLLVTLTGVGWAFPRVYLRNRATARRHHIEQSLPDMIDMLNMCVSQGLTVPESLRRIAGELRTASPALAQELRIVCEQAEIGTLPHALENFAARVDSEEVRSFTSLLIQTERMGTNISRALIEYSDNFRDRHRQEADRKANNAAFKLLFPTVLCLMPAVYLVLLGPAVLELSNFLHGDGRQILERGQQAVEELNDNRNPPVVTP